MGWEHSVLGEITRGEMIGSIQKLIGVWGIHGGLTCLRVLLLNTIYVLSDQSICIPVVHYKR